MPDFRDIFKKLGIEGFDQGFRNPDAHRADEVPSLANVGDLINGNFIQ